MIEQDAMALAEVSKGLAAPQAKLDQIRAGSEDAWTVEDLRRELDRWDGELRSATNALGQHYPDDTVRTHIGHSAQFIRWLAGTWQPHGPRTR